MDRIDLNKKLNRIGDLMDEVGYLLAGLSLAGEAAVKRDSLADKAADLGFEIACLAEDYDDDGNFV
jgi:NTP pyrophosphatase (non-canonical NTP hydrolase)